MDLSLYLVDGFQIMKLMPEILFIRVRIAEKISSVMRSKVKVMQQRLLKWCELDSPSWWTADRVWTKTYTQCLFCDGTSRYGVPENLTTG